MRLRHQLAAFSPIRAASIGAALRPVFRAGATTELAAILRDTYAATHIALVDSGTHALQLALAQALRARGNGALVALPGFTCFDVATAAVGAAARVTLYDIDPETLEPDFESLAAAFRDGATIAVIASLYGMPISWDRVEAAAAGRDVLLIEDAAQGHGATWQQRPLGSFGHFSVLSFSRGKGWTGGYGGALLSRVTEQTSSIKPARIDLKGVAALAAQWILGRPSMYGLPRALPGLNLGETVYHDPTPVRAVSESAAAALLFNRDASLREARVRKASAIRLRAAVSRSSGVTEIAVSKSSDPGFLRFPFRVPGGFGGLGDTESTARLGIAPSYPRALAELGQLHPFIARPSRTPGATELATTLVTAPTHSLLSETDLANIEALLASQSTRQR